MVHVSADLQHKRVVPFEEAISLTKFGRFQILVLFASGGCLMSVIMETMGMMFVTPAAQCDLNLNLTEKGILAAISFLGVVMSSHMWGFIADTKGRRKVILYSMVLSAITSAISSIAPYTWLFILMRFVNGFAVGGASSVVYAYSGEFNDNHYRPKVVSWLATFVALGNIALPSLAWIILPQTWSLQLRFLSFRPWRLLVLSYGLPSSLFAFFVFLLPESPKYLLSEGKHEESLNVLRKMYAVNNGKAPYEFPVTKVLWDEANNNEEAKKRGFFKTMWKQTVPLFKKPLLSTTFMLCVLQFGTFGTSSGLFMWIPEILNNIAMFHDKYPNEEVTVCAAIFDKDFSANNTIETPSCTDTIDTSVFHMSLVIGTGCAIVYLLVGSLINILGKKNILVAFFLISTLAAITSQNIDGPILVQGFLGLVLLSSTCIGIINAVVVDLYPTQFRAMALAMLLMFGRFGAVAGSHITGAIFYNTCSYSFYIFSIGNIVLAIVVLLLPTSPTILKLIDPVI